MLRGFLVGVHHSQNRLELRKTIGDKSVNSENVLEWALHVNAVIRIEEEKQTPPIAAMRREQTEILIDLVNRLVQQMSVGHEKNAQSCVGRRDNSH